MRGTARLLTERLQLRRFREDDAEAAFQELDVRPRGHKIPVVEDPSRSGGEPPDDSRVGVRICEWHHGLVHNAARK